MCVYLASHSDDKDAEQEYYRDAKLYLRAASSGLHSLKPLTGSRQNSAAEAGSQDDVWYKIEALNDLGLVLLKSGELDQARECFLDALAFAPSEWDIQNNLAVVEQKIIESGLSQQAADGRDYADVKQLYNRTIALAPAETLPRMNLAFLLEREGAHEAALFHFAMARSVAAARRGANARADVTACVQGQARVWERLGNFAKAIEVLEARISLEINNANLELHLATLMLKQSIILGNKACDQSLARVWRARAIAADPQAPVNVEAVKQWADEIEGYIYRWMGLQAFAELYFERCAASSEYARASLSLMAYKAKDYRRSEQHALEAHEIRHKATCGQDSTSDDEAYYRACLAAMTGATEDAITLLKNALTWQPAIRVWARVDPDFERVADDLRFVALVGPPVGTQ